MSTTESADLGYFAEMFSGEVPVVTAETPDNTLTAPLLEAVPDTDPEPLTWDDVEIADFQDGDYKIDGGDYTPPTIISGIEDRPELRAIPTVNPLETADTLESRKIPSPPLGVKVALGTLVVGMIAAGVAIGYNRDDGRSGLDLEIPTTPVRVDGK